MKTPKTTPSEPTENDDEAYAYTLHGLSQFTGIDRTKLAPILQHAVPSVDSKGLKRYRLEDAEWRIPREVMEPCKTIEEAYAGLFRHVILAGAQRQAARLCWTYILARFTEGMRGELLAEVDRRYAGILDRKVPVLGKSVVEILASEEFKNVMDGAGHELHELFQFVADIEAVTHADGFFMTPTGRELFAETIARNNAAKDSRADRSSRKAPSLRRGKAVGS